MAQQPPVRPLTPDSLILDPLIKSQQLLYLSLKQSMDSSRPGPGIRKPQSHSDSLKIASGTSDTLKPRPDSGKAVPGASGPPGNTPHKAAPFIQGHTASPPLSNLRRKYISLRNRLIHLHSTTLVPTTSLPNGTPDNAHTPPL